MTGRAGSISGSTEPDPVERAFATIAPAVPEALLLVRVDGRLIAANERGLTALAALDCAAADPAGDAPPDLSKLSTRMPEGLRAAAAAGSPTPFRIAVTGRDGTRRACHIDAAGFMKSGGAAPALLLRLRGTPDAQSPFLVLRQRIEALNDEIRRRLESEAELRRAVEQRDRLLESQELLVAELNHRVKNTLAIVKSIARESLTPQRSVEEARERLDSRILALARGHDLLTRNLWRGASLAELIEAELAICHDRIGVDCCVLDLGPRATLSLAMILHELCANALRHGALLAPDGRVSLRCHVEDGTFFLQWRERGGPAPSEADLPGFGRRLIEQAASFDLGATTGLTLAPEGARYDLSVPVARLAATAGHAPANVGEEEKTASGDPDVLAG